MLITGAVAVNGFYAEGDILIFSAVSALSINCSHILLSLKPLSRLSNYDPQTERITPKTTRKAD
jgi:hypothetical protein